MTISEDFKKEIVSEFGPSPSLNDEVFEKLSMLKQMYNISVEDLYVKWESFNVTGVQEDLELTTVNLERFQDYLQQNITNKPQNKKVTGLQSSGLKRKPVVRSGANNPSTPNLKKRRLEDSSPSYQTPRVNFNDSSPGAFETANNSFQSPVKDLNTPLLVKLTSQQESNTIIETLNPEIKEALGFIELDEDSTTSIKPFKLASNFDANKYSFRTMSMKLLESADVLDEQIDSMTQLYHDSEKYKNVQFGNPCLSTQFDIICCGRIVPDSPSYNTNTQSLNSTSLYLETSRLSGIGQRVPLDLAALAEYSLFPGQIVVLKGRNPTGRTFIVQEIMDLPQLGAPLSSSQELQEYQELTSSNGLKLLIASGPFSNQHTLDFQRLEQLVQRINNFIKPHVVILYGPFIDLTNLSVIKGEIELPNEIQQPRNLDEVFKKMISPIIRKINPRIQVIMIPSLKDSAVKHCSYPQDAFDRKKMGLPKNVKVFPNPSSFSINEVLIGNSNLDIFKDLKDVSKMNDTNGKIFHNRFERIANHIFDQRRYYPVFPGSIQKPAANINTEVLSNLHDGTMREEISETGIGGSCLEVPYLGLTELGDSIPDILINPSELRFFAKVIKGVVVINPGYFIKPNRDPTKEDGSYAIVSIEAPDVLENSGKNVEPTEDNPDLYYHNVYQRARVDIYKS